MSDLGAADDSGSDPSSTGASDVPGTSTASVSSSRAPSGYAPGRTLLGKYRIVRKLGAGGMAEVYQAEHLQLGSQVALKLPLGRHAGALGGARLLREAQVAASLDPDRVVRVYDIGTLEDGTPFIVLEYLAGKTLAEMLSEQRRLPIDEAVHYIVEACLGLVEAHRRGIVHRDIKPSNLFVERRVDSTEKLKILDFGIASIRAAAAQTDEATTTLTDSSATIGSPPYMAPEQVRGATGVDARCDVWALGASLYQLVSGKLPFRGNASALIASILSDAPAPLAKTGVEVPPALEDIILRCLSKDPKQRPASAIELADELRWFRTATRRRPASKRSAKRWGALVALGGFVVIAFLAAKQRASSEASAHAQGATAPAAETSTADATSSSVVNESVAAGPVATPAATPSAVSMAASPAVPSATPGQRSSIGPEPARAAPHATASSPVAEPVRAATSALAEPPLPAKRALLDEREF